MTGWQPGAAQRANDRRAAGVEAKVAAARARARGEWPSPREFERAFDRYDEAEAAEHDARQALPGPAPHEDRCDDCGYRLDALGHRVTCEAAP